MQTTKRTVLAASRTLDSRLMPPRKTPTDRETRNSASMTAIIPFRKKRVCGLCGFTRTGLVTTIPSCALEFHLRWSTDSPHPPRIRCSGKIPGLARATTNRATSTLCSSTTQLSASPPSTNSDSSTPAAVSILVSLSSREGVRSA